MNAILLINEDNNVVICVKPLTAGEVRDLNRMSLTVKSDVLCYQKLALFAIRRGDLCYSFGRVVGREARDMDKGEPVRHQDLTEDFQENQLSETKCGMKTAPKQTDGKH